MNTESLHARNGDVRLVGSLWRPGGTPRGLVLMHPGSGPSDRDNDVLFPPIRDALLDVGVAVCSFDKRGVGESSGSWLDAGIDAQASDLLAGLGVARAAAGNLPTGLFGHSQGGWVVLEAARAAAADFVITNSGPSVSPREQEIFSTEQTLRRCGWDDGAIATAIGSFSAVMDLLATPFAEGWPRARDLPWVADMIAAEVFIPSDERLWSFAGRMIDHDPRPALRALRVPLLAVLGAEDRVVPVRDCAEVFRATVRPDLLDLRILSGGDHRLQNGDEFIDGYLDVVTSFVVASCATTE